MYGRYGCEEERCQLFGCMEEESLPMGRVYVNERGSKEVALTIAQVKSGMRSVTAWKRFRTGDLCDVWTTAE